MNGNANYLVSPNKLSTKVAYAPGGHSSLSLVWDAPEISSNKNKPKPVSLHNPYQNTQPRQNYQQPQMPRPYEIPKRQYQLEYYQPKQENYNSMSQSNRLLEEQLLYYQQKNKMLRQNVFGGYQNLQKISKFASKHAQFEQQPSPYYSYNPQNSYAHQYPGSNQELDMAIIEHTRKRQKERMNSQSSYKRNGSAVSGYDHYQQKTSVKVNNPPGGRSSIVFG